MALARTAEQSNAPLRIVETVIDINDKRRKKMAAKVVEMCQGSVQGKTIAVLGLTFKPNTDDMREAPSLEIIPALQRAGAKIRAFTAELCERVGGDVHDVARGIGLDGRIGSKFLHPGPGYGGSCFPKDTMALARTAEQSNAPLRIVETVIDINDKRRKKMAAKVVEMCQGSVQGKTIAVLGLTFKPNTDDMREAPSLEIIPVLQRAGAKIRAFDPEGMDEAKKLLDDVAWADTAYDTLDGADAVVIITEWNEFRALDLNRVKEVMKSPVMIDLRNIYDPDEMMAAGFDYACVGRQKIRRTGSGLEAAK